MLQLHRALTLLLVLLILGSCGGSDATTTPSSADAGKEAGIVVPGESSGLIVGGEGWPGAIPEGIPPLAGDITMVMSGESHVRLFYAGVSDDALLEYLDQLEGLGYELEYVVYSTPASEERAQERADAGEWDAVRAKKGDYDLNLAFGGGTGTFDIGGIPMDGFGPDTSWPEEWVGVPAPSLLPINEVTSFGESGPTVEVAYDTDDDIDAYVTELEAAGFAVTDRAFDQNHEIISVTVSNGTDEVYMRTYPGGRLHISVSEAVAASSGGSIGGSDPGIVTLDFPDWLPEVPGGELITAMEGPGGGFTAVVVIGDGHTVAEYVAILEAAGYSESETMLAGYVRSNGERTITIFGDDNGMTPLQIMIQVTVP